MLIIVLGTCVFLYLQTLHNNILRHLVTDALLKSVLVTAGSAEDKHHHVEDFLWAQVTDVVL